MLTQSRDARELQRCTKCYWFQEHSTGSGDPDVCGWSFPENYWDIIDDTKRAIDCDWYIEQSIADKLVRGYCRAMAQEPELPPPEFGEDSVKVWRLDNNAYKLEAVEIQYEE